MMFKVGDKVIASSFKLSTDKFSMTGEVKEDTVCVIIKESTDYVMEGRVFFVIEDDGLGYRFIWPSDYLRYADGEGEG